MSTRNHGSYETVYKVKSKNPVCNNYLFVNESEMNPVSAKHKDRKLAASRTILHENTLKQVLQTKSKWPHTVIQLHMKKQSNVKIIM